MHVYGQLFSPKMWICPFPKLPPPNPRTAASKVDEKAMVPATIVIAKVNQSPSGLFRIRIGFQLQYEIRG
jgi:hypothetical protein